MALDVPYYRIYLKDKIRKFLGINYKNKKIYAFKVNHKTYLSTDTIPKSGNYICLKVVLAYTSWAVDIPVSCIEYEPYGFRLLNTAGKVLEITKRV